MANTLQEALNNEVLATLGALQFEAIGLRAQVKVLREQVAALTPPPAGPPAPPEGST